MTSEPDPAHDLVLETCDPADERRRESLLALGNGVLLLRTAQPGAVADGHHYPGLYRAGLYDRREACIDGVRVDHDCLVNLPDPFALRIEVGDGDGWLPLDAVEVLHYRHGLDTRRGIARRDVLLRDRAGRRMRLREERLVSMARPSLVALRVELTLEGWSGTVRVRSTLSADVWNGNAPQEAPGRLRLIEALPAETAPGAALVRARTMRSRVEIAVAARTQVSGADGAGRASGPEAEPVLARPGAPAVAERVAAVVTARDPAVFEPGETALAAVRDAPGFAELRAEHALAWEALWARCPLAAADPALGRALRLHAFHLLQTVSPHSAALDAGFPARGWQEAYFGQVFWDQTFAVAFFAPRVPALARALLLYRWQRLDAARAAARRAGLPGAMFPWRSAATGRDETPPLQPNPLNGRWLPDETHLQRHVGAIIAHDVWRYVGVTGDTEFLADHGAELIVEIARFWAGIARPDPLSSRYDIAGVVGPDEYHTRLPGAAEPGLRTNAYTNVMAAWVLRCAPGLLEQLPPGQRDALCRRLRLDAAELALWDRVSRGLRLGFLGDGVISQFHGYEGLAPLDLGELDAGSDGERADLALDARGASANSYQVAKQPDVVMLLHVLSVDGLIGIAGHMGYTLTAAQLGRTAAFYIAKMAHDSSLSEAICAGALARLDPAASWRMYRQALAYDADPAHAESVAQGLHLGAMAGTFDVLQRHYLGLDLRAEAIVVDPAPPPGLGPVRIGLHYRGTRIEADWSGSVLHLRSAPDNPTAVSVRRGSRAELLHPGQALAVFGPDADAPRPA